MASYSGNVRQSPHAAAVAVVVAVAVASVDVVGSSAASAAETFVVPFSEIFATQVPATVHLPLSLLQLLVCKIPEVHN